MIKLFLIITFAAGMVTANVAAAPPQPVDICLTKVCRFIQMSCKARVAKLKFSSPLTLCQELHVGCRRVCIRAYGFQS